jgi:hypothetical protein
MEDMLGIGKVVDSKLAEKVYDDAASPAVRQLGQIATDAAKTFRLFLAPLQLTALAQDRFAMWLDEVRTRVPPERQIEAEPTIAGPAIRAMLFMQPDNPLVRLYLNLLTKAIDKDTASDLHPAFVTVMEQMCPDEAILMWLATKINSAPEPQRGLHGLQLKLEGHEMSQKTGVLLSLYVPDFPTDKLAAPSKCELYLDHLVCLGLLATREALGLNSYKVFDFTQLGDAFAKACIPSDLVA